MLSLQRAEPHGGVSEPHPLSSGPGWARVALLWAGVWVVSRAMMLGQLGVWRNSASIQFQDVAVYRDWSASIAHTGRLPTQSTWQYPPGASLVFMIPRLFGSYEAAFIVMMILVDACVMLLLARMAMAEGCHHGVWMWVLGIPVLGSIALLRFDLVPTALAIAAFACAASPVRSGVLAGLGAMVKAWPVAALVVPADGRSGRRAAIASVATAAGVWLVSQVAFGNPLSFLSNQQGRGLEVEAIAATPWYVAQAVRGVRVDTDLRNGAYEVYDGVAQRIAELLVVWMVILAVACVAWTVTRHRLVREGRRDLAHRSVGADAMFTAVLLFMVVHEVLSPQFMIWLIGLGAVALTFGQCRVRRPVLVVAVAVMLTRSYAGSWLQLIAGEPGPAWLLVMRNAALLFAAVDAAVVMVRLLRSPSSAPAE